MLQTFGWQHCQWHCLKKIFLFLTELGNFKQKIFWRLCHWQCCQAKVCSIVKGRWFGPLLFLYHIKIGTCLLVTITVPMLFSPKTNFSPAAIGSQCLKCSDQPNLSIVRNQPNRTFQPFFVRNYRTEPNRTLYEIYPTFMRNQSKPFRNF